MKKQIIPSIIPYIAVSVLCVCCVAPCLADDFSSIKTINPLESNKTGSEVFIDLSQPKNSFNSDYNNNATFVNLSENDTFYHFVNATDKFVQCNIQASWDDFKTIISQSPQNDFVYVSMANKMADLGLFDLANTASSKIQDQELSRLSIESMKRFYFPKKRLKLDDELFLAEIYSNILYNDQSTESTNELLKKPALLASSDYANYIAALGSYKSGLFTKADQYISVAIEQNPSNLNYLKLKAEILADSKKPQEALKVVGTLKKQNLYSFEYERKIKSLEQYVLYKGSRNDCSKNYHLGYYYYLENDSSKAIRTLQDALTAKKEAATDLQKKKIYALMSEIYLNIYEYEKAADTAKKAYKINKNDSKALISLGDLSLRDKNYKQALKYYKQASNCDKTAYAPLIKEAQVYQEMSDTKKAQELYIKVLKTHSDSWEAYYNTALLDKEKKLIYIKKALAVNPLFKDGWIELAKMEIDKTDYELAAKYLANAFYIDENDFRYYYYQGLVNKSMGNYTEAEYNFKKCLKLNAKFEEAQKELSR